MSTFGRLRLHVTEMVRSFDPRVSCLVSECDGGATVVVTLSRDRRSKRLILTRDDALAFFSSLGRMTAIRQRITRLLEGLDAAA